AALDERLGRPRESELLRAHARTFGWNVGLDALEALLERARRSVRP
ncbi:MAG: hypothetical protein HUU28_06175, partial [Planctomycetaceae bacterium]|nr:hypothetical protein [Planctomycetaceae bacterium]